MTSSLGLGRNGALQICPFYAAIKVGTRQVVLMKIDRWSGLNSRRACFRGTRNLANVFEIGVCGGVLWRVGQE